MIRRRIVLREVCIPNRSVTRIPSLPEVGQANDLNNLIQTACHTRPRLNERREALCEDFPYAGGHIAKVFADLHEQTHMLSSAWQVCDVAGVAAMQTLRWCATQ